MSLRRFALGAARGLVWLAAGAVPSHRRDAFVREWEGELAGGTEMNGAWEVLRAAAGAFADARALRAMERSKGGGMGGWIGGFWGDGTVVLRSLRRSPGFTAVAVITLALGLGGSAALWALLDRVVLQPLPYPEPERLVRLENQVPGVGPNEVWSLSTAQWVYFTDHASTLEAVGLYRASGGNVMTASGPERVRSVLATASTLELLGARASLGRVFGPDDDTPAAPSVVLMSRGFWERVLGSDPSVVGTALTYNDEPVEVVGVLAGDVELPGWSAEEGPDLWFPLRVDRGGTFYNNHVLPAVGRLAPGATPDAVEREIATFTPRLAEAFPRAYSQAFFDRYGFRTRVTPLKESVLGDLSRNLWILFGGVGLVLLVACVNVANLFVVRVEGRRRELDIRAALGAGRAVLARYVVAEGMTLSLLGAGAGLLVAYWAVPVLTALAPADLPRVHGAALGGRSILFTLALAVPVGLMLAAYPLITQVARSGPLSDEGRTHTVGRRRARLRSALVVTQVAVALTLVAGAGILLESLARLRHTDVGFEPGGVIAVDLYLSYERHGSDAQVWAAHRAILDGVRALPGVASAGMSTELPVSGGFGCTVQGFEDATVYDLIKEQGRTTCAGQEPTSPGYLETMGIPLLEGRTFTDQDNDDPRRAVAIVSKAFAERFWPGRSALGQGVAPAGSSGPFYRVVGVVGDVPASPSEGEPPLSQRAIAIYYPIQHNPDDTHNRGWWPGGISLVVKTDLADPVALFPAIRRVVAGVDPEIPLANATEMEDVVAAATSQLAFVSLLLGIAAGTALLLAAVGLYGVLSYVVGRRTREIGMRMAVGARPGDVRRMVVAGAMSLVAWGLVGGVALALAIGRMLGALIVGVRPMTPSVYALAVGVLAGVALVAAWLPAWRASRIDPVEALRSE